MLNGKCLSIAASDRMALHKLIELIGKASESGQDAESVRTRDVGVPLFRHHGVLEWSSEASSDVPQSSKRIYCVRDPRTWFIEQYLWQQQRSIPVIGRFVSECPRLSNKLDRLVCLRRLRDHVSALREELAAVFRQDDMVLLRWEDVVVLPVETLRGIDIDVDAAHAERLEKLASSLDSKHAMRRLGILGAKRYNDEIPREHKRVIAEMCGEQLERLGYDVRDAQSGFWSSLEPGGGDV